MPKKNMTPEERKAFGEKMKAARSAKAQTAAKKVEDTPPQPTIATPIAQPIVDDNLDLARTVATLQTQLQELLAEKALDRAKEAKQETPGFGTTGSLIGSFEKYITDPHFYPDPRERLSQESRLQRFAFPMNYELNWAVSTTQYETIDNRRVKEPRFTVELVRVILDEDTGEQTNQRYIVCRGIFHEDPEAAIEIAGRNGVAVDESNQKAFLDEMRYLRIRDWLLEAFYPPKPDPKQNKRETVIGNKLVEVYEVSSEVGQSTPKIPFGDFSRKL